MPYLTTEQARINGSKGGRPKGSFTEATKAALTFKELLAKKLVERQEPIVEALLEKCEKGDVTAIKEMLDRLFGQSKATIDSNVNQKVETVEQFKTLPNEQLAALKSQAASELCNDRAGE